MSRTIRAFDNWNNYNRPDKMQRDGVRRSHTYKSDVSHLGEYFGEDVFNSRKQLKRQLNKQSRMNSRKKLREMF